MSRNKLFGILGLLCLTFSYCNATIRCLECKDMFKPFFCDTVTVCSDNEECYVERVVTSGGQVLFNSGCRSKLRCDVIRKRSAVGNSVDIVNDVIPADSSSDILVCQECCNGTHFCNIKGCNEAPPLRTDRGPYCFACSNQNEHGCRHVTTCDMNYACEITRKVEGSYTIYDSSCVHVTPTSVCNTTYGSRYSQSALIGKRGAADGCPKCCDWDFCNEACTDEPPVGGLTNWQSWSPCQNTCGGAGNQIRMRTCTHPPCTGSLSEHRSCGYQTSCPVDGGFSDWNVWSGCTTTCGTQGTQSRHRSCNKPAPAFGGKSCQGNYNDVILCGNYTCPSANTVYTTWTQWTACTVSCGPAGSQQRNKICYADNHVIDDSRCQMPTSENRDCNNFICPPVDGAWGMWSPWQICSVTCGHGIQSRSRECNSPFAQNGGKYCAGDNTERGTCTVGDACPITDEYTEWGSWGSCTVSCGKHGNQMRSRTCKTSHCSGTNVSLSETRPCNHMHHCVINGGWSAWQQWGHCTATCGSGKRVRTRTCNHPPPKNGGTDCQGNSTETQTCHHNCQATHCQAQAGYALYPVYHTVDQHREMVVVCINIYNRPSTWYEARSQCQNDGADLVTFNSDVTYLNHLFPRLGSPIAKVWIGLEYINGDWTWVDNTRGIGSFATSQLGNYYTNHIHNVAGSFTDDRACVTDNGQSWVPVNCHEKHNFVCEKPF